MGIIELIPQVTVSPQEPLQKSQPFSVPFRIDNSGYLTFHVDHVFCYANESIVSGRSVHKSTDHQPDWNNFDLERSEAKTIVCQMLTAPDLPGSADIAIVIDIRTFPWSHMWSRRYFRFVGAHGDYRGFLGEHGDNWQWLKQPSAPIQKDADYEIAEHMRMIPSSR